METLSTLLHPERSISSKSNLLIDDYHLFYESNPVFMNWQQKKELKQISY